MAGLEKCYITQINYLSENGLLGMECLDEAEKIYIFYKREDDIPVLLHIGIQQNVTAQIEYVEAEAVSYGYRFYFCDSELYIK